ncbi:transposase [Saprospiraceae bacterium]|nr:transposase [Saprospiraceae bacterium]
MFTRKVYNEVLIETMKFCIENKGLSLHAYVIMSNHMHVIMSAKEGHQLSDIVRDFKKYTATSIIDMIQRNKEESRSVWMIKLFKYFAKYNKKNKLYQFWQRDNKPIELSSPKWIYQKLAYIHINPVRAGIVDKAENYLHSSAGMYIGKDGQIEMELLDIGSTEGYVDS